jgi:hypothetical protein
MMHADRGIQKILAEGRTLPSVEANPSLPGTDNLRPVAVVLHQPKRIPGNLRVNNHPSPTVDQGETKAGSPGHAPEIFIMVPEGVQGHRAGFDEISEEADLGLEGRALVLFQIAGDLQ